MKKQQKRQDPITYLKVFLFIVFVLITISLGLRLFKLVSTRKFNSYSFNILLVTKDAAKIVHIDSDAKAISQVRIDREEGKNLENLRTKTEISYELPLDAVVERKNEKEISNFLSFQSIFEMLLNPSSAKFSGLNSLDVFKAYLVSKSVNDAKKTSTNLLGKNKIDARSFLKDIVGEETLLNEKTSVEVVNATDVSGLGTSVAQMLETAGFDVVSITSGKSQKNTKLVKRVESSEAVKRLERVFGIQAQKQENTAIADITLIIGDDFAQKLN